MGNIMIVDQSYDRVLVEGWGQELRANAFDAFALALGLLQGVPHTGHQAALLTRFRALSPWNQAGVVDELRDALDQEMGEVFRRYVAAARAATGM